jgi:CSLREA domain-containing protein
MIQSLKSIVGGGSDRARPSGRRLIPFLLCPAAVLLLVLVYPGMARAASMIIVNASGMVPPLTPTPTPTPTTTPGATPTPTPAFGQIAVNTTTDELNSDGDCSLREAIQAANTDAAVDACPAGSGTDAITLPAGTYVLGSELAVATDQTLSGAGVSVLQGTCARSTEVGRSNSP